jgi:hypothetical protein
MGWKEASVHWFQHESWFLSSALSRTIPTGHLKCHQSMLGSTPSIKSTLDNKVWRKETWAILIIILLWLHVEMIHFWYIWLVKIYQIDFPCFFFTFSTTTTGRWYINQVNGFRVHATFLLNCAFSCKVTILLPGVLNFI